MYNDTLFVRASKYCKVYCCLHLVTWTDTLPVCIVQPWLSVNYGNSVLQVDSIQSLSHFLWFSVVSVVVLWCLEVWWPFASTLAYMQWFVYVVEIVAAMLILFEYKSDPQMYSKNNFFLFPGVKLHDCLQGKPTNKSNIIPPYSHISIQCSVQRPRHFMKKFCIGQRFES